MPKFQLRFLNGQAQIQVPTCFYDGHHLKNNEQRLQYLKTFWFIRLIGLFEHEDGVIGGGNMRDTMLKAYLARSEFGNFVPRENSRG